MDSLLLFSDSGVASALPALELLGRPVRVVNSAASNLAAAAEVEAIIVDGTTDLAGAKHLCTLLQSAVIDRPVLLVLTEGGLPAVQPEWGVSDVVLSSAGPAEVDARLRLLAVRGAAPEQPGRIQVGNLVIDEDSYTARFRGRTLDLTFKEFELLRYLAAHPNHVFSRERLLSEVWGYDYYGGTRTVDVHVRRLRAKLGDQESIIGTVRNVGYQLVYSARSEPAEGIGKGDEVLPAHGAAAGGASTVPGPSATGAASARSASSRAAAAGAAGNRPGATRSEA